MQYSVYLVQYQLLCKREHIQTLISDDLLPKAFKSAFTKTQGVSVQAIRRAEIVVGYSLILCVLWCKSFCIWLHLWCYIAMTTIL